MFRVPRLYVLYISTLLCLILSAFPHICVFVILKKGLHILNYQDTVSLVVTYLYNKPILNVLFI